MSSETIHDAISSFMRETELEKEMKILLGDNIKEQLMLLGGDEGEDEPLDDEFLRLATPADINKAGLLIAEDLAKRHCTFRNFKDAILSLDRVVDKYQDAAADVPDKIGGDGGGNDALAAGAIMYKPESKSCCFKEEPDLKFID